ncbi:YpsA SLOG family protein [Paraburkholderia sp. SG-MS1]|uniref:YpsA SLOG family protein n=1 Tax=Paraburkholderia sp. SG-MS1 TaxID=2023741 RepID=UPI0014467E81
MVKGTELTLNLSVRAQKPHLHIDLMRTEIDEAASIARAWINRNFVRTLNVAGPRQSEDAAIYADTYTLLTRILLEPQAPFNPGATDSDVSEELALGVYEQAMENWRHWDNIRWLVPNWYYTFAAAVATFAPKTVGSLQAAAGMILIVGILSIILLRRLDHYHCRTIAQTNASLNVLLKPGVKRSAIKIELPFSLSGWKIFFTATYWYQITIFVLIISSFAVALNWDDAAAKLETFLAKDATAGG